LDLYNSLVGAEDKAVDTVESLEQRELSLAIETVARAEYREVLSKGAGSFLFAVPSEELGFRLSPAEWTVAVGRRIGCPSGRT
jgi:hypothetical protein